MDVVGGNSKAFDTRELFFLVAKFLEASPCQEAAEVLKKELSQHELLPTCKNWLGEERRLSYKEVEQRTGHAQSNTLQLLCNKLLTLLDKHGYQRITGLHSLLGAGTTAPISSLPNQLTKTDGVSSTILRSAVSHRELTLGFRKQPVANLCQLIGARQLNPSFSHQSLCGPSFFQGLRKQCTILGHLAPVFCVLFDHRGDRVITGADDNLIKIWSSRTGQLLATLRGHSAEVCDLSLSHDNTMIASGSLDKSVRVWCAQTSAPLAVLIGHQSQVTSVQFSPSSIEEYRYLASTGKDGFLCFWQWISDSGSFSTSPIKFMEKNRMGDQTLCSGFSPGGKYFVTGGTDRILRIYVCIPGPPVLQAELTGHTDRIMTVQFGHTGGSMLASGSCDGTVGIWRFGEDGWKCSAFLRLSEDDMSRLVYKTNQSGKPEKPQVTMVGWESNDRFLVTAFSPDCHVRVWRADNGELVRRLEGHSGEVFVLEPHPLDSRILLTAGHDGLIIVWDMLAGTQLVSFTLEDEETGGVRCIFDCKFSPDATMCAAADIGGYLTLFGFGSGETYKHPKEQFFHTDYHSLMHDRNHFVIDETTQLPPHLLPPPYLVDIDGNAHSAHHQEAIARLFRPVERDKPGRSSEEREDYDEYMKKHLSQIKRQNFVRQIGVSTSRSSDTETRDQPVEQDLETSQSSSIFQQSRGAISSLTMSQLVDRGSESQPIEEASETSSSRGAAFSVTVSQPVRQVSETSQSSFAVPNTPRVSGTFEENQPMSNEKSNEVLIAQTQLMSTASQPNPELTYNGTHTVKIEGLFSKGILENGGLEEAGTSHLQADVNIVKQIDENSMDVEPSHTEQTICNRDDDLIVTHCNDTEPMQYTPTCDRADDGKAIKMESISLTEGTQSLIAGKDGILSRHSIEKTTADMNLGDTLLASQDISTSSRDTQPTSNTEVISTLSNSIGRNTNNSDSSLEKQSEMNFDLVEERLSVEHIQKAVANEDKSVEGVPGGDECVEAVPGGDERVEAVPGGDERVEGVPGGDERVEAVPGGDERVEAVPGGDERVEAVPGGDERVEAVPGGDEPGGDDRVEAVPGGDEHVEAVPGGDERVEVVDGDGESVQNMLSSLVYSLGLSEIETKQCLSLWQNRTIIHSLDSAHLSSDLARRTQLYREEETHYCVQVERGREVATAQVSLSPSQSNPRGRSLRSGRTFFPSEPSTPSDISTSYSEEGSPVDMWDDLSTDSGDISDWTTEVTSVPIVRKKSRRKRNTNRRSMAVSDDEVEEGSKEEEDDSEDKQSTETNCVKKPTKGKGKGKWRVSSMTSDLYSPPDWIMQTSPKLSPYLPQVGDIVVYCRQGHELYMKSVQEQNIYSCKNLKTPWQKYSLLAQEFCQVTNVRFCVGPPTLCSITLALLSPAVCPIEGGASSSQKEKIVFSFKYHDMDGVLDFLILESVYKSSIQHQWEEGDQFQSLIDGANWRGTILERKPFSDDLPHSYWQCYHVTWDDGVTDSLSPWDMQPIDSDLSVYIQHVLTTPPSSLEAEWGGRDEQERIKRGLEAVFDLDEAHMFREPVSLDSVSGYCDVVAFPTDLGTIRKRLENGLYRRKTALLWEVAQLLRNALAFNMEDSLIVKHCRILVHMLWKFISSPDIADPTVCYEPEPEGEVEEEVIVTAPQVDFVDTDSMSIHTEQTHSPLRADTPTAPWTSEAEELLRKLCEHESSSLFLQPVDTSVHKDYLLAVRTPMDLSTVGQKLTSGLYSVPNDFISDIKLIFKNAKTYNRKGSWVYKMTTEVQTFFETLILDFLKAFPGTSIAYATRHALGRVASSARSDHPPHNTRSACSSTSEVDLVSVSSSNDSRPQHVGRCLRSRRLRAPSSDSELGVKGQDAIPPSPDDACDNTMRVTRTRSRTTAVSSEVVATSSDQYGGYTLRTRNSVQKRALNDSESESDDGGESESSEGEQRSEEEDAYILELEEGPSRKRAKHSLRKRDNKRPKIIDSDDSESEMLSVTTVSRSGRILKPIVKFS